MRIITGLFLVLVFLFAAFGQKSNTKLQTESFNVSDMDGQSFDNVQLKGKIVLLAFWSTRCPICTAEIPKLNRLAASFTGKDVVFLALTAENELKVKNHLRKKPFDFNIVPNSFGMILKFADRDDKGNLMMGYPAYYLINQKGEIELKTSGYNKSGMLDKQINRLLMPE